MAVEMMCSLACLCVVLLLCICSPRVSRNNWIERISASEMKSMLYLKAAPVW